MIGSTAPAAALRVLVGLRYCCPGALDGPDRCTCWEPVHDLEQQPPRIDLPAGAVMPTMCADCAYRPDSPERAGDDRYEQPPDVLSRNPFHCHYGMRRAVAWQHPLGITVVADTPDGYDPPGIDGIPYQADGTPALRCAGWSARHEVAMRAAVTDREARRDALDVGAHLYETEQAVTDGDG